LLLCVCCSCRTRALFAELQDTLTKQWGIPVTLETELEAQRRVQEFPNIEQHWLGLCPLVAAGADEASLPITTAKLLLDGDLQDSGNDHQEGWEPARRTAREEAEQLAEAAAQLFASSTSSSSGNGVAAAAGGPAAAAAAAPQVADLSGCFKRSSGGGGGWTTLLGAIRGGHIDGKQVTELAQRVVQVQAASGGTAATASTRAASPPRMLVFDTHT
jgi:hypothetical protein